MTSYIDLDATAIAASVRSGEVSASEIRDSATAQYLRTHGDINAVVEWYEDPTPVTSPDGQLAGVPLLRKDYGSTEAGRLTEMGSRLAAGNVASETSQLFTRLRDSGAQVLGRSATPEFVQHGATETTLNGVTRNPLDRNLSPGGSSGGAAAAVAAGVVPIAHGSDCAGSIRIPASACGLVGLKPGMNRVQLADGGWGGIANEFVLTKTVRDCRLLLDILGDGPYLRAKSTYRIGISTTHWAGFDDDGDVVAATRSAAGQLAAAGHELVEVDPPVDYDQLMDTFSPLFHRWLVSDVDRLISMGREAGPDTLEPLTLVALEHLRGLSVADISAAQITQGAVTARLERDLADVEVLLTPTLGRATIPLGKLAGEVTDLDTYIRLNDEIFPYSYLFNVTGWPAISVPGQVSVAGLPVGVQLSARRGTEHRLLDLARTLWPDPMR